MSLSIQQPIKAFLIDLDGTLVDSIPFLFQAYLRFLQQYGIVGTKEEFDALNGPSIKEIVAILQQQHNLAQTTQQLYQSYRSSLDKKLYPKQVQLYPGVEQFLHWATQNKHWHMFLVTSNVYDIAQTTLQVNNIQHYFSKIITAEDLIASKPNPAIYQKALREAGLQPFQAIAIEDSNNGALAATRAGIPTIVIHRDQKKIVCYAEIVAWAQSWFELKQLLINYLDL